jgi:hypothetical protein
LRSYSKDKKEKEEKKKKQLILQEIHFVVPTLLQTHRFSLSNSMQHKCV